METLIANERDFEQLLQGVASDFDGTDWQPWMDKSFGVIEQQHARMFGAQQHADGRPWAPLAPSTVKRKGHSTILLETGRLRASLTQPRHGDGVREQWDEWPRAAGLIFGTEVPYSQFHETGTKRMPARPHVGMNAEALDVLTNLAADHALAELVP